MKTLLQNEMSQVSGGANNCIRTIECTYVGIVGSQKLSGKGVSKYCPTEPTCIKPQGTSECMVLNTFSEDGITTDTDLVNVCA
jgi:hypothetical protein